MNPQDHPHAISWEAMEFIYQEKTKDWYWILWIIFLAIGALAYLTSNYSFAILIVLSAFVLSLLAAKRPVKLSVVMDDNHIHVGNKKYRTSDFSAYNILEQDSKLILRSKKQYVPVVTVPLSDSSPLGKLRGYLLEKKLDLDDTLTESPLEVFAERLGF